MYIILYKIKRRFKKLLTKLNIYFETWVVSKRVEVKNKNSLFIDCGSNLGQSFQFFKKFFRTKDFDFILIEPNPNCIKELKRFISPKVQLLEKGVWSHETYLKLYGIKESNNLTSSGTSLIKDHNSAWYESKDKNAIKIETISLSDLIKEKKQEYDNIILKLDIESSEYTVLQSLINEGSIDLIDHIFVEFHSAYFDINNRLKYENQELEIKGIIKSKCIGLTDWK